MNTVDLEQGVSHRGQENGWMRNEVEAAPRESFFVEVEDILVLIRTRKLRADHSLNYLMARAGHMNVLGLITLDEALVLRRRANEAILNL